MIMLAWFMRWRLLFAQVGAAVPAIAVAVVTGYASWGHIVDVGLTVQEPSAALLPVAVDGMMLAGTLFALVDRLRGFEPRGWAVFSVWLGSLMTVSFNILSAVERGWAAMAISAVYAVTFLATVESAFHPSTIILGQSARAIKRGARLALKVARAQGQAPVTSAVEPPTVAATSEPTPEAPQPVTQAVEPSSAPVAKPPRKRRQPNKTTQHQPPRRSRPGREDTGTGDVVSVEATAEPVAVESDATDPADTDTAVSVPAVSMVV